MRWHNFPGLYYIALLLPLNYNNPWAGRDTVIYCQWEQCLDSRSCLLGMLFATMTLCWNSKIKDIQCVAHVTISYFSWTSCVCFPVTKIVLFVNGFLDSVFIYFPLGNSYLFCQFIKLEYRVMELNIFGTSHVLSKIILKRAWIVERLFR